MKNFKELSENELTLINGGWWSTWGKYASGTVGDGITGILDSAVLAIGTSVGGGLSGADASC